jgi:hypothetical protein
MEAHRDQRPAAGGQHSTWIAFAGVVMAILGFLDVIWGIAAIANNEVVVVGGHGVLVFDITTWGWVQLIVGIAIVLVGLGLLAGASVSRWAGIGVLALNAVLQVVWFSAAPLWALMIIALDVILIYQLCVNWTEEIR